MTQKGVSVDRLESYRHLVDWLRVWERKMWKECDASCQIKYRSGRVVTIDAAHKPVRVPRVGIVAFRLVSPDGVLLYGDAFSNSDLGTSPKQLLLF